MTFFLAEVKGFGHSVKTGPSHGNEGAIMGGISVANELLARGTESLEQANAFLR